MVQNNIILNICASTKSTGMKFYRVDVLQELHIRAIYTGENKTRLS